MYLTSIKHPNTYQPNLSSALLQHTIPILTPPPPDLSHPRRNNHLHIPLLSQHLAPQIPKLPPQKLKSKFPPSKNSHTPNLPLPQYNAPKLQPPAQQKGPRAQKPLPRPVELLLQRARMGGPRARNSGHENKPPHPAPLLPPLRLRRPLLRRLARPRQTRTTCTPKQRRRAADPRHRVWKWVLDVYASPFPRSAYRGDEGARCAGCG